MLRLEDFVLMGVQNVWLIDPLDRVAFTYQNEALKQFKDTRLKAKDLPIYLDLSDVFAALD
jgi:Uma2 family endonuclease